MNRSGQPVASLLGYYKVEPVNLIVIHDELDLGLGRVKLKLGGGHGGHNGIRDIKAKLGQRDFSRVRFGISKAPEGWDTTLIMYLVNGRSRTTILWSRPLTKPLTLSKPSYAMDSRAP